MNLIRRYIMVLCVGIALLFGIQIPNFLDQYEKRIDAHLREVTRNLSYYQEIATKHHAGSLYSLIASHKSSANQSFKEEGTAIENMYNRKRRFEMDQAAMNAGLLWNSIEAVRQGNRELLQETIDNYSYAVPLNQDAIVAGVAVSMTTIFLVESLFGLLGFLVRILFKQRNQRKFSLLATKLLTKA